MPTYTYRCNEHNHEFQVRQRMTDEPLTECEICGGRVRRVVSSVGVVFKGSGFYVTDNRSSSSTGSKPSKAKSTESEKASATESTSTTSGTPSASAAD